MNEFRIILEQVSVLLIILAIGYAAGRIGFMDAATSKKLSHIVLYITTPMTILNAFFIDYEQEHLTGMLWTMGFALLTFLVTIPISRLIFRRSKPDDRAVMNFTSVFSNATYMGFPLLTALFGDLGVFYGSFYTVVFTVFLFSYGSMLFSGQASFKATLKQVLTNTTMIAVYVGVIIFFLRIPIPTVVQKSVSAIGSITMPASMLVIGGVISTAKLREVFLDYKVYLASAIRLILMPLVGLGLAMLFRIPTMPATIIVTCMAMPAATSTTMFAELAGRGSALSSRVVTVSTILSLATAPLLVSMVARLLA